MLMILGMKKNTNFYSGMEKSYRKKTLTNIILFQSTAMELLLSSPVKIKSEALKFKKEKEIVKYTLSKELKRDPLLQSKNIHKQRPSLLSSMEEKHRQFSCTH